MKNLVYLAAPYSNPDPKVRKWRWHAANLAASILMTQRRLNVFSPISTAHISEAYRLPTDAAFWYDYNRAFIEHSHLMVVLRVEGWQQSKGVAGEIKLAGELGISLEYMDLTAEQVISLDTKSTDQ